MFKQRSGIGGMVGSPTAHARPMAGSPGSADFKAPVLLDPETLASAAGSTRAMMLEQMYPTAINFYRLPPLYDLSLSEFEDLALLRLKLLKGVETAILRAGNNQSLIEQQIVQTCKECGLHLATMLPPHDRLKSLEQRKMDHISHYILRLAFCRKDSLRDWFIKQEAELFMVRLQREALDTKRWFLDSLKLNIHEVPQEEVLRLQPLLAASNGQVARMFASAQASGSVPTFYKVPFEQVLDLVGRRQVYIHKGYAYVPESQQAQLLLSGFKKHLENELLQTAKALPRLDEEDRLVPILESLSRQYQTSSFTLDSLDTTTSMGNITADQVPFLVESFPPCMRHLQDVLNVEHHLKHQARLQYGLFLKGIGVSVEEALIFWRRSFSKVTDERFSKEYAYNVRYNYGLEGKRTNYSPYSCRSIITSNQPSSGDHHGCPFKHFGDKQLSGLISEYKVNESFETEIMRYKQGGHYQLACSKLFEATAGKVHDLAEKQRLTSTGMTTDVSKGIDDDSLMETVESGNFDDDDGAMTIEHPNQYFKEMIALQKKLNTL